MAYLAALAIAFILWSFIGRHAVKAAADSAPKDVNSFHSKVVGVTHKNADGKMRQDIIKAHCRPGQSLVLKPEPDNPKDPLAIGVWLEAKQLGYLPAGRTAEDILRKISSGQTVTAKISSLTGGTKDKPTCGVNIQIFHE